jgi:7-carboxy-7-deazaguanine synthase
MTYRVKEIFYTLQGEGSHAGRPAVFCRFTSCNLWTEHERSASFAIQTSSARMVRAGAGLRLRTT